jgi:hypothetical protein
MSGDWRRIGGNLELMAVLAVNLPGFPVLRTKALVASGATQTLLLPIESDQEEKEPTSDAVLAALRSIKSDLRALKRAQWAQIMEKEA